MPKHFDESPPVPLSPFAPEYLDISRFNEHFRKLCATQLPKLPTLRVPVTANRTMQTARAMLGALILFEGENARLKTPLRRSLFHEQILDLEIIYNTSRPSRLSEYKKRRYPELATKHKDEIESWFESESIFSDCAISVKDKTVLDFFQIGQLAISLANELEVWTKREESARMLTEYLSCERGSPTMSFFDDEYIELCSSISGQLAMEIKEPGHAMGHEEYEVVSKLVDAVIGLADRASFLPSLSIQILMALLPDIQKALLLAEKSVAADFGGSQHGEKRLYNKTLGDSVRYWYLHRVAGMSHNIATRTMVSKALNERDIKRKTSGFSSRFSETERVLSLGQPDDEPLTNGDFAQGAFSWAFKILSSEGAMQQLQEMFMSHEVLLEPSA